MPPIRPIAPDAECGRRMAATGSRWFSGCLHSEKKVWDTFYEEMTEGGTQNAANPSGTPLEERTIPAGDTTARFIVW